MFFSEVLSEDDTVVLLETGPFKLEASCLTITYNFSDLYGSSSSYYTSSSMNNSSSSYYTYDSSSYYDYDGEYTEYTVRTL